MLVSTMRFLRRAGSGLLAGLLLTGCAGPKTAFTFQSASLASVEPAYLVGQTPPQQPAEAPLSAAAVATAAGPVTAAAPRPVRPATPVPRTRPLAASIRPARRVSRHYASQRPAAALRRPADEGRRPRDTVHIVLGAVLIVGSVLVGLWLGGWLGLGVGAAIMLLGDYFLVLGIGGRHAWLEIFQEFFNM